MGVLRLDAAKQNGRRKEKQKKKTHGSNALILIFSKVISSLQMGSFIHHFY
jgi:hypothetical protein